MNSSSPVATTSSLWIDLAVLVLSSLTCWYTSFFVIRVLSLCAGSVE
ncbi:hypothetical protein [Streptomyces ossamyceticus]|jgi:hypothetical protein|nr:hypothetical protein [Streptomyces ossamyceticus]